MQNKPLIRYGSMQNPGVRNMPIPFAGISPLPCPSPADATFHKVLESGAATFPTFPDVTPYASMIPLLRPLEKRFHICQVVVSHPASDVFRQTFLQPKEAFAVTAFGNDFEVTEKLLLTLLVHCKSASTFFQSVEGVAEKLLSRQCARHCLFLVDFQKQFLLHKGGNAVSYSFGSSKTLYEYYTVVCVTDIRVSSAVEFLVEFIQYDVTQYGTQWSALGNSFGGLLVLVSHHYPCIQVLMDK